VSGCVRQPLCCVGVLPDLDPDTGLLPAGAHDATLDEVVASFGVGSPRRRELCSALTQTVDDLRSRGVHDIWIAGSFVTSKLRPNDVDVVYDPAGNDITMWGLLDFRRRAELKRLRRVDLWPYPSPQPTPGISNRTITILEFFQTTREHELCGVVHLIPDSDRQTGGGCDQEPQPTDRGQEEV
jgi:hypothetical protein